MKLVVCTSCLDVIKLDKIPRVCKCRRCGGRYLEDGVHATYWGDFAIPIGVNNFSLVEAIRNQPEDGKGKRFTAFVIPKNCSSMRKES
jgi:hypothetical protein